MFCSRSLNHKINRLHKRTLRIAYDDYKTAFEDLIAKAKTVTIHQRNLKVLAIEMYKIANDLSPDFTINLLAAPLGRIAILLLMKKRTLLVLISQIFAFLESKL